MAVTVLSGLLLVESVASDNRCHHPSQPEQFFTIGESLPDGQACCWAIAERGGSAIIAN